MKNKSLFEWVKAHPKEPATEALLLRHLESLATIDDDALQKRLLKELIRSYVALEKRVDSLLKNTLPAIVAEEIKYDDRFLPRSYQCTILFTDFIGFTGLAETIPRTTLIETLNVIFTEFDNQINYFKGTKIKTIGDAYMAVFGAPIEYDEHPVLAIRAALDMIRFMERFNSTAEHPFNIRIGIHTGQVAAGVVGKERMQFDVFGDDVNIASRFESSSTKNRINISEATYTLCRDYFDFEERGPIQLKNKANMKAYFVLGEKY
ncbi:adenylate/guanylate cyclase domain-containing protein [Thermodesulfobacteriota bacterium]